MGRQTLDVSCIWLPAYQGTPEDDSFTLLVSIHSVLPNSPPFAICVKKSLPYTHLSISNTILVMEYNKKIYISITKHCFCWATLTPLTLIKSMGVWPIYKSYRFRIGNILKSSSFRHRMNYTITLAFTTQLSFVLPCGGYWTFITILISLIFL